MLQIAESAKGDRDNDYVQVIDEINRGNLGKILGEGLMLLEADKRSEKWALRLAYQAVAEEEEPFYLPPNLYVIGTMNTADHSLVLTWQLDDASAEARALMPQMRTDVFIGRR